MPRQNGRQAFQLVGGKTIGQTWNGSAHPLRQTIAGSAQLQERIDQLRACFQPFADSIAQICIGLIAEIFAPRLAEARENLA